MTRRPLIWLGTALKDIRAGGAFRVFYFTKRVEGIVVLHAFQKKSQQTAQLDVSLAAKRLRDYLAARRRR